MTSNECYAAITIPVYTFIFLLLRVLCVFLPQFGNGCFELPCFYFTILAAYFCFDYCFAVLHMINKMKSQY